MTKNNAMRLGSVMLVLALLTTCALSGTFAKYVSTATPAANSAKVAKWGLTLKAEESTTAALRGFQTTYASTATTKTATTYANSVVSTQNSGKDPVIAPGTSGTLPTATVSGTPEVVGKISLEDSTVTPANWNITVSGKSTFYCPLVFTITYGTKTVTVKGTDYADQAKFKEALEKAFDDAYVYFEAGKAITAKVPTVTWEWPFEDTTTGAKQTNEKDTLLANLTTAPTITFNMAVKAEQLD